MVGMIRDRKLHGDVSRDEFHQQYIPVVVDGVTPIYAPSLAARLAAALAPTYESLRLLLKRDRVD